MSAAPEHPGGEEPLISRSDVNGWFRTFDEFDRKIAPLAVERGYSRDAVLLTFFLNMAVGALRSIEAGQWVEPDDESDDVD